MEKHYAGTNEGQGKPSIATKPRCSAEIAPRANVQGFHGTDTSWGVTAVTELFFAPCEVERMSEVGGMVDELADRHRGPRKTSSAQCTMKESIVNILLWYLPYAMFSGACDIVLSGTRTDEWRAELRPPREPRLCSDGPPGSPGFLGA